MTDKTICKCAEPLPSWTLAVNEDGWCCQNCYDRLPGDPPGYRPDLDRDPEHTIDKATAILNVLHDSELLYVSNSGEGEHMALQAARRAHKEGLYDQHSLLRFLVEQGDKGTYWKGIGDGVMANKDPRDRCHCGKLATMSRGDAWHCDEHGWALIAADLTADPVPEPGP